MLKDFTPRLYQETILATAATKNTLVVLPTGLGKTGIALLLTAQRLQVFPNQKVLFLAPTKPLAQQHLETFKTHLQMNETSLALFTGEISPEKREELWKQATVVFSTPQGLENDIISERIKLEEVSLLIVDEAHRAVGDYSYVFIAKQYLKKAQYPKILGLTASPGDTQETIEEVCKNLFIEEVELRTEEDPDVQPYVQQMEVNWIKLELPQEFQEIRTVLTNCFRQRLEEMKTFGFRKPPNFVSKTDLLQLQKQLFAKMSKGEKSFSTLKMISLLAEAIKIQHALELLETQGILPLQNYITKLFEESTITKVKAVKNLCADIGFKTAKVKTQHLYENKIEHPKIAKLREILKEDIAQDAKKKVIIFTQFRDTATAIASELKKEQGVLPQVFVGQAKKKETGLSQKQQKEMLDQFKDGLFNVLVATSVGEEGLDIPKVDKVIFYEPIPSAIRAIQRRGRTGRQEKGAVTVLVTKNTRDEGYLWSSRNKEKRMHKVLSGLKKTLTPETVPQQTIQSFDNRALVFADYREKNSDILKQLMEKNVQLKLETLQTADYLVSSRAGIEVKKVPDFVASLIDGRLLEQIRQLKREFARPLVIIEGEEDIFAVRNVHPNAIRGMLAMIVLSYGIPVLQTKNSAETADLILALAKREQQEEKEYSPHAEKRLSTFKEQQEYIVSALPNIGPNTAKELLKHFKTVKNLANASEEELKQATGVGEKLAKGIKEIMEKEYKD